MSLLDDIAAALDLPPSSLPLSPEGGGGGSGFASTGVAKDSSGRMYFYKKGSGASDAAMLNAEYEGVKEMHGTNTIRVPEPLAFGSIEAYPKSGPFVVFEHLRIGGGGDGAEMGRKLAAMHRVESPDGRFGFRIDNTIGATPQRNTWEETWADFFIKHRFYAMLQKCSNLNFETSELREVRMCDVASLIISLVASLITSLVASLITWLVASLITWLVASLITWLGASLITSLVAD